MSIRKLLNQKLNKIAFFGLIVNNFDLLSLTGGLQTINFKVHATETTLKIEFPNLGVNAFTNFEKSTIR